MNTLGIDIGGTKIAAVVLNQAYETLTHQVIPTPPEAHPEAYITATDKDAALLAGRNAMRDAIVGLCADIDIKAYGVQRIGIGAAGQVDSSTGTIIDANDNIVGWKGAPIGRELQQALNIPVIVENDVRTMALAETTIGAGRDYEHVLCIAVGTGIGGAIVINGELWRGAHFSAGEIGYIFGDMRDGNPHSIEELYAGASVGRLAFDGQYSLREIVKRAHEGDEAARDVVVTAAKQLSIRLAPVVAFLDPEAVVVGGGVSEIGAMWWEPFLTAFQNFRLATVRETPIIKAELGNRAGMIGAAILAMKAST